MRRWTAGGLMLLTLAAVPPAMAQPRPAVAADSLFAARLRLSDRLLTQRQTSDAVALLEALDQQRPGNTDVANRLALAYRVAAMYREALAVVVRLRKDDPSPDLDLRRAELLALTGDTLAADTAWQALLPPQPTDADLARVLPSMTLAGRPARAAALLDALPDAARRTLAVRRARASLAAQAGDRERAVGLYLDLVDDDPQQAFAVQDSLVRLAETPAARPALRAALDARIERASRRTAGGALFEGPGERRDRETRLKTYLHAAVAVALASGESHDALERLRALDRLDGQDGRVLVRYARAALDARAFEAANTAFADVIARYPRTDAARDALFGLAETAEAQALAAGDAALHPEAPAGRAADAYRRFAEAYPAHPSTADALARRGRLLVDGGETAEARRVLDDVRQRFPRTPAADDAAFQTARLLLRDGQIDEALDAFDALAERLGTGNLADQARFEQATALLFRQRFDEAQTLLGDLANRAASDAANDAIALGLLVQEARTDSASTDLARYARALLRLRQGHAAEAADSLTALAAPLVRQPYAPPILDDVLALRADALRQSANAVFAAEAYDDLTRRFPRSIHADAALLALADLYAGPLVDPTSARSALERLLQDFPGSLLADEARARLRLLGPR